MPHRCPGLLDATGLDTPTARPDLSERACFLTVPFQATVKSLCVERPVDAGSAEMPVAESHRVIDGQIAFLHGKDSRNTAAVYESASGLQRLTVQRDRFLGEPILLESECWP